ncbi:uncharacterized protein LAJ45_05788 [Morchella importuna]|uniref:uncharacterized protein n=1 Tax=Morchella importuna TaxID=1174673 RepID=UPI001E8D16FB|nr:uncharacterized protein LAJ45_05788 [Morchella importuna]KAH8150102.1 hypothetical protein LAJ45_05788 [Morchella importuna]
MAQPREDYEMYGNLSPLTSPGTNAPEFFTPGSPPALRTKFGYSSIPSRSVSQPSTNTAVETCYSGTSSMERLERVRSKEMQMMWGTKIHWFLPSTMVTLLFLGLLGALAHHLFYQSLDGKEAKDQLMMMRIGTALAFFTKAMLVGSVVVAYRQRIWDTMRRKPLTLRGIDSLFAVVEDPTHFFSPEIYKKAKLATAMAVITWIIPLASVLSPAALTTELAYIVGGNNSCEVHTVNFTSENINDWRKPRFRAGESLAFWNVTPTYEAKVKDKIEWFDQPSFNAVRLFTLTTMSHTFIPMKSPCMGFNCTWELGFEGPWYNCTMKRGADLTKDLNPLTENDTFDSLAPKGNKMYFMDEDSVDYQRPQKGYDSNDIGSQGIFYNEPKIWLGWVTNTTNRLSPESEGYNSSWPFKLHQHLMQCELQRARYDIEFEYINNVQVNKQVNISNGVAINPQQREVRPADSNYKEYAAYHGLGQLARKQIVGKITQDNYTEQVRTFSLISQTKLVNPDSALARRDLRNAFQTYFEEIIISLLSENYLGISYNTTVACVMHHTQNNFRYQVNSLWSGYAISIVMALACIIVGGLSLRSNGITSDTTFSKIMVTTRNRTIDRLVEEYEGVCLGGDPFPEELKRKEFQFGVIDEISSTGANLKHAAFGVNDEVIPIQKGDSYARVSARGSHYQRSNSWLVRSPAVSPVNTRFARGVN